MFGLIRTYMSLLSICNKPDFSTFSGSVKVSDENYKTAKTKVWPIIYIYYISFILSLHVGV